MLRKILENLWAFLQGMSILIFAQEVGAAAAAATPRDDASQEGEESAAVAFVVEFSREHVERAKALECFQGTGLSIREGISMDPKKTFVLIISADFEHLLRMAEAINLPRLLRASKHASETSHSESLVSHQAFTMEARDEFLNSRNEKEFFTSAERVFLLGRVVDETLEKGFRGREAGAMPVVFPLHEPEQVRSLQKRWVLSPFRFQPLNEIRSYLGEEIAYYFAFLGAYTSWLVVPSVTGVFVWYYQITHEDEADVVSHTDSKLALDNWATTTYALFLAVWVSIFMEFWKRREKLLALEWGTVALAGASEELHEDDSSIDRPSKDAPEEFVRYAQLDPVTEEWYVPQWRVVLGYFCSLLMYIGLVSVAVGSMWFFLHLADYAETHWTTGPTYTTFPWMFARYAPAMAYTGSITVFTKLNSFVAGLAVRLELHRTRQERDNSVTVKLVTLQFANYFLGLSFTAFWVQDLHQLKSHLVGLLVSQQILGQILELGLPILEASLKVFSVARQTSLERHSTKIQLTRSTMENSLLRELALEDYPGVFSDYLELWVQMGQSTLFASVFPLAACFALVNNLAEIRTDAFKILNASRRVRPRIRLHDGIGVWKSMFELLGYAAVVSNVAVIGIVAFKSEHVQNKLRAKEWTSMHLVLSLVALEHAIVALKILYSHLIPDVPEKVSAVARALTRRERLFRKHMFEQSSKMRQLLGEFHPPSLRLGGDGLHESPAALAAKRSRATMEDLLELSSSTDLTGSPLKQETSHREMLFEWVREQRVARLRAENSRKLLERELAKKKRFGSVGEPLVNGGAGINAGAAHNVLRSIGEGALALNLVFAVGGLVAMLSALVTSAG